MQRDQPGRNRKALRNAGHTLEVFLDPILVYALWQNNDSALNMPRDDDLSRGDSQILRSLLDL